MCFVSSVRIFLKLIFLALLSNDCACPRNATPSTAERTSVYDSAILAALSTISTVLTILAITAVAPTIYVCML